MARWFIAHEAAHFWLGQAVALRKHARQLDHGRRRRPARRPHRQRDRSRLRRAAKVLNDALTDCSELAVQAGRHIAIERGEERAYYACGAVFALVAEKASKGDFDGFVRRLIDANRADQTVDSAEWLAALDAQWPATRASAHIRRLLEPARPSRAEELAGLLESAGIAFTLDANGVPQLMRPTFEMELTARPEHIDELGHVNNAVWVQWIQEVARRPLAQRRRPGAPGRLYLGRGAARDRLSARRVRGRAADRPDLGRRGAEGRALRPPHGIRRRGRQGCGSARAPTGRSSTRPAAGRSGFRPRWWRRSSTTKRRERSCAMSRPVLYDYFRSSAAYRVRIALNLKGVDYEQPAGQPGRGRAEDPTTIARSTRRAWCRCWRSTATG